MRANRDDVCNRRGILTARREFNPRILGRDRILNGPTPFMDCDVLGAAVWCLAFMVHQIVGIIFGTAHIKKSPLWLRRPG